MLGWVHEHVNTVHDAAQPVLKAENTDGFTAPRFTKLSSSNRLGNRQSVKPAKLPEFNAATFVVTAVVQV